MLHEFGAATGLIDLDYGTLNVTDIDPAKLASVNETYLRISTQQDADETLKLISATVKSSLGAGVVAVMLGDEGGTALRAVHVRGEGFRSLLGRRLVPDEAGAAGRAYRTGKPCLFVRGDDDPDGRDPVSGGFGLERALSVPLISRGRCIGSLTVYGGQPEGYTDQDLTVMLQLAGYAAVSVDNSTLIYELKREKMTSELLFDRLDEGLMFIDHSGVVAMANRALDGILGISHEEVIGRHISELAGLGKLGEALVWPGSTAGTPSCHEYKDCGSLDCSARKSGTFRCWTTPSSCGDGSDAPLDKLWEKCVYCGYLGELSDRMSAPREIEFGGKTLRVSSALVAENGERRVFGELVALQDLSRATRPRLQRSELISMLSHDLKTPLTMIVGYSDLISGHTDVEKMRDMGRIIRKNSNVLLGMINNILEYSALESGAYSLNNYPTRAGTLIGLAVDAYSDKAAERGVRLEADVSDGSLMVDVDTDLAVSMIGNLVINAIKYGPDGGTVRLVAAPGGDGFAEITVRDEGPGVPEDDLPRIFDKYFRSKRTSRVQGTGLGLSIVKSVAEAHGGRVYARNLPEGGMLFGVVLPVSCKEGWA